MLVWDVRKQAFTLLMAAKMKVLSYACVGIPVVGKSSDITFNVSFLGIFFKFLKISSTNERGD